MDGFQAEALTRVPLAEAVWLILRHVADEDSLNSLFEAHRGVGSSQSVTFPLLVELIADALLTHHGSGRQSFEQAQREQRLTASVQAVYGKLGRLPPRLSEAFLAQLTERLRTLLPAESVSPLPAGLQGYQAFIFDGKKIKNLSKRVKALRGLSGKALAAKLLVGLFLNDGLVSVMHASLDGEANDAPLTTQLLEQVEQRYPGPLLFICDSQFCDLSIPPRIDRGGHAYVIRYTKKMLFFPEREQRGVDPRGRATLEEWGWLGSPADPRRFYVRRVTVFRPGEEDVAVITNLLNADRIPANEILDLYLDRWTIERVFQQVTEVLQLDQLISSTPQGAVFQFALCALLYNLIQVVRAYVAQFQQRPARSLSSEMLWIDIRKQLAAGLMMTDRAELLAYLQTFQTQQQVLQRISQLLNGPWSRIWIKCPPKKNTPRTPTKHIPGGHFSAWKHIQNTQPKSKPQPHPP